MNIFTFKIRFNDGATITRTEWGKNRRDALKTIQSIYPAGSYCLV